MSNLPIVAIIVIVLLILLGFIATMVIRERKSRHEINRLVSSLSYTRQFSTAKADKLTRIREILDE